MSRLLTLLALALLLVPGGAPGAQERTEVAAETLAPARVKAIEEVVRAYLLEHPEVILEAVQRMQAREEEQARQQAAEALAQSRERLLNDPASPIMGNPDGDVTVVEFFDYNCQYCRRAHPLIAQLVADDPGVRVVLKEFPILSEGSLYAARFALAVHREAPEQYLPFHEALYATRGAVDRERVLEVARQLGLDADRLAATAEGEEIGRAIQSTYDLAERLGIQGTPGFVIGDEIVPGLVELDRLKELVDAARRG